MSEKEKNKDQRMKEFVDGALQAMLTTEMQLDALRRQADAPIAAAQLDRIRLVLREEVIKLRELVRPSLDVDSSNLLQFLRNAVARGLGDRGTFISELDEIDMPSQVCRELARFVEEYMPGIRMSRTRNVLIRLTATESHWQLTIEGDGRRVDDKQEDGRRIREQARLTVGEVTASNVGDDGWRWVVTVPKRQA